MKILCLVLALVLLCGCSAVPEPAPRALEAAAVAQTAPAATISTTEPPPTTLPPDPVEELFDAMSLEEKVGQLFLARCPGEEALAQIGQYHFGGYILFGEDFEGQTPDTMKQTISAYQQAAAIPMLIAVDEEGGTVCRVSYNSAFRSEPFPSPRSLFDRGGMEAVLGVEAEKAYLLSSLGINVNMAPVCDIATTPGSFMYRRSLGQDAQTVGQFALETTALMKAFGVGAVWKHFPGYGENADTHTGSAIDRRSLQELESWDLVPFAMGAMDNCEAILVSHNIVTALDDGNPATLSPAVHQYLRSTLGFQGVIVTDDLMMEAITQQYGIGEAAILAVLAGNDLLCSTDYAQQYTAVLEAVQSHRIDMDTLDAAVMRILRWKQSLGLIG